MQMRKAGIGRDAFADLVIVFHRAGTERIKVCIHTKVPPGQFGKMPHHIQLTQLRQFSVLISQQRFIQINTRRHIAAMNPQPPTPFDRFFKY